MTDERAPDPGAVPGDDAIDYDTRVPPPKEFVAALKADNFPYNISDPIGMSKQAYWLLVYMDDAIKKIAQLQSDNRLLESSQREIDNVIMLTGIGPFKTWQQAQEDAYKVIQLLVIEGDAKAAALSAANERAAAAQAEAERLIAECARLQIAVNHERHESELLLIALIAALETGFDQ